MELLLDYKVDKGVSQINFGAYFFYENDKEIWLQVTYFLSNIFM